MDKAQEKIANRIIERLDVDISDRRGLKWEWGKIDEEVMDNELKPTWRQIITEELNGYRKLPEGEPPLELTPSLRFELEGTIPEWQDRLAWLLNYASAMGDYGDPHGILAVISPQSGRVLVKESDCPKG